MGLDPISLYFHFRGHDPPIFQSIPFYYLKTFEIIKTLMKLVYSRYYCSNNQHGSNVKFIHSSSFPSWSVFGSYTDCALIASLSWASRFLNIRIHHQRSSSSSGVRITLLKSERGTSRQLADATGIEIYLARLRTFILFYCPCSLSRINEEQKHNRVSMK